TEVLRGPAPLVAFLDDDDLWRPEHLARSRAALVARPDAVFVHGAAVTRSPACEIPYHAKDPGPFDGPLFLPLLRRNFVATSSVVVRGDVLRTVGGFRADLRHAEDWDLWLKASRHGPATFVPETTVVYRDHGGNVSRELVDKIEDQAAVVAWWRAHGEALAPEERRAVRAELARRRRRNLRRLRRAGTRSRAQLRAAAAAAWREVPHLHTAAALLGAALLPRGRKAPA
ncbi:MAG TPA: glycosyltransferase family 2 protein, partial [Planctomycetota bacterium]|nr:glycosyltransferase family 2 protein [Planctomycetota bacterium]